MTLIYYSYICNPLHEIDDFEKQKEETPDKEIKVILRGTGKVKKAKLSELKKYNTKDHMKALGLI